MKFIALLSVICVVVVIGISSSFAQSVTVEPDASIYKDINNRQLELLVALIKAYGYRCDSVSAARPFLLSYGFTVLCNGYRYEYEIEDKGGNWVVTVD